MLNFVSEIDNLGFAVVDDFIDEQTISFLTEKLTTVEFGKAAKKRGNAVFGVRNLLNLVPETKDLAADAASKDLVKSLIGNNARVVRGIFFDKQAEANWKVPFHQDLSVAVREKIETDGFTAWTRKAEIHHVQPPVSILEKMVTLRIHLDETDESNGALKVVPNSHRFGRLSAKQTEDLKQQNGIVVCKVSRGAAMLMRPLLLHASSQTEENKRRRIIHLEFSAQNLPNGLQWYGS